jgi:hypothetical protein
VAATDVSWTSALSTASALAASAALPTATSASLLGERRKRQNQKDCKQTR